MALRTFFSGPPDSGLSDITRSMIADEANQNAARANQMQFFANLAGQRSSERLGRGRNLNDAEATAAQERVARLPFERLTPAQAGQLELEKQKQRFFEQHPELFGDSRTRIANADRQFELEQIAAESDAAAAMANAELDATKVSIFPEVSGALNTFRLGFGRSDADSDAFAKLILDGKDDLIPEPVRKSNEYIKAKKIFDDKMIAAAAAAQQKLGKNALLVRIDPVAKRFVGSFARAAATPGPSPFPAPAPVPAPVVTPAPAPVMPSPAPVTGAYRGGYGPGGWAGFRFFGGSSAPAPGPAQVPIPAPALPPGTNINQVVQPIPVAPLPQVANPGGFVQQLGTNRFRYIPGRGLITNQPPAAIQNPPRRFFPVLTNSVDVVPQGDSTWMGPTEPVLGVEGTTPRAYPQPPLVSSQGYTNAFYVPGVGIVYQR